MYDRHVEFTTQVSSCVGKDQQNCTPGPAKDELLVTRTSATGAQKPSRHRSCFCKT